MTDLRTAAQQALGFVTSEAWGTTPYMDVRVYEDAARLRDVLQAALAQQAEPDAYGYASRLAVAIWEKHYKGTAPHWKPLDDLMGVLTQIDNMTSGLTRLAQQAEPLNLRDPAVRKRLATQWGYVPAAQAEPVEPVAWVRLEAWKSGQSWPDDCFTALPAEGLTPLYTAPPQRKPLTEQEIESCRQQGYAHAGLSAPFDFGKAARAVERAHGIKE